jgi:Resolvase, N terminal domain
LACPQDFDVLVVTKLDRLGRNSIDVQTTVKRLDEMGVRVHCLALGGVDLTTRRGRQTISIDRASTLGIPLGNQSMICAPSHCVATRMAVAQWKTIVVLS